MLVELLRPIGPELARRWMVALMMVDEAEREAMVSAVERQIVELYQQRAGRDRPRRGGGGRGAPERAREVRVVSPPVQRDGYVEEKVTTYEVKPAGPRVSRTRSA